MKIKRVLNGVEVEIELTQDELAEAYLVHEHFYDCESVRAELNSGCYEEFDGLTDEEWEEAVHEIAYEARRQQNKYGLDEWDALSIARKDYVKNHNRDTASNDALLYVYEEMYKKDWYKAHGITEDRVSALREEYRLACENDEFEGSFDEYEFERGYGGEIYACFEEFVDCDADAYKETLLRLKQSLPPQPELDQQIGVAEAQKVPVSETKPQEEHTRKGV